MFRLDRKKGTILYMQLKKQIVACVEGGAWLAGKPLPRERDLASQLGVSRTTVSLAYRELVEEGYLKTIPGRGTVVVENPPKSPAQPCQGTIYLSFIDGVLDRAIELGIDCEEFAGLLSQRVEERRRLAGGIIICFIECNSEQLDYFAKTLNTDAAVSLRPLLVEDLRRQTPHAQRSVLEADLIVTTLYHVDEVSSMVKDKQIIVIEMEPDFRSIVQISRIPPGERVALVGGSKAFTQRAPELLASAGISDLDLTVTATLNKQALAEFVAGFGYVIATSFCLAQTKAVCAPETTVIELVYQPDKASIRLLTGAVWRRRMRAEPVSRQP